MDETPRSDKNRETPVLSDPGISGKQDPPPSDPTVFGAVPVCGEDATVIGGRQPLEDGATVINASPPPKEGATIVTSGGATIVAGAANAQRTSIRRSPPPAGAAASYPGPTQLQIGSTLGNRYEILELLGEGGMGAVYKAADLEVDRTVALKVIRPDMAANPEILARFKQELLLSSRVTHRNVIRIYDLGDADGVKFITMEYIEGKDLRSILHERKKLPPEEAVEIALQVCHALEEAHGIGIIHRDLKPQNIMMDHAGRVVVMDFGLARTLTGDGMTQTGAMLGTMEYMSPEQALGKDLDQRSDIFALGLILYELLAGERPFVAESALASLIKRTQESAVPVLERNAEIPGVLGLIVDRCLERDLTARYQKVSEIFEDLTNWKNGTPSARAKVRRKKRSAASGKGIATPGRLIAAAAILVVLGSGGYLLRDRLHRTDDTRPVAPAVSLAILPFRNASSDSSLDWLGSSLADMLTTDVGQSASLRTVSPNIVHQIFNDLRITPSTALDPGTVKRVADFSTADRVVWGQYAKFGDTIRIDATLQDLKNNRTVTLKADVPSEKDIPSAVDRLADSIRQTLELPRDVMKQLKASSFQPTSSSVEALRDYNQGLVLLRDGKNLEAEKQFDAATRADPGFALAFARLAQSYSTLGYDSEAEQSAQKAVMLSQNLPEAERFQISAIELQVNKHFPEAIKAYENLARVLPDNADVRAALARLYEDSGDLAKAKDYYQRILTANPKDIGATIDMGRIQLKTGDPQGALEPLTHAYSLAVQMDNQEQKATSLHLTAVAYRMLNKPQEVLRSEQEALTIWRQIGQQRGLAFSLNEMARAQANLGNAKEAMANFDEALQIRRDIGDKRGLGDTLIDMGNLADDRGDHNGGLKSYKEALQLEREIGNESMQAVCLNNIGSVYLEMGQYEDALAYLQQVLQLREKSKNPQDIVDAEHNLGQALTSMGEYDQAISYYMKALQLRRSINDSRGAALESYGLGGLFDFQGRYGAAIHSKEEALKTFRDLKDRTFWMAEILDGYAQALTLAGRMDDVKGPLGEAMSVSRELKNDGLVAQTLEFQGDAQFYKGNFAGAHALYDQAMPSAAASKEPERILLAKVALAQVAVREKKGSIASLRTLMQQADDAGLKYSSVQCELFLAEAMLQARDAAHARQEIDRALLRADKLGQQPLSAHAHYLLGAIARDNKNNTDARDNFRWVVNTLDGMKKDPGAENLLLRDDMKKMYADASAWLNTAGN
ncbi:tetratricopeptide repeat protein [Acidobacteria bacterium AB60]|nr:tetratricopeptide repeat protein [Acidobacteria bacterium AB60]